jgi:hypothetical protein
MTEEPRSRGSSSRAVAPSGLGRTEEWSSYGARDE